MKQNAVPQDKEVCIGVITSVSGVKGYVKIRSFTESPSDITKFNKVRDHMGNVFSYISLISEKKGYIIAGIHGINNRNDAEKLRNIKLFINRSEFPEPANEEYYHADLIGLEAKYEDGSPAGVLRNVVNFGAGDILEIYDILTEKTLYYPFNKQFVSWVNLENKYVVLSKIEDTVSSE
jgi:16S rRNA processing protein RimM